jgi:hypothetical protein
MGEYIGKYHPSPKPLGEKKLEKEVEKGENLKEKRKKDKGYRKD